MSLERVVVPQWRDDLLRGRYPFADNATLTADSGAVVETDTLLDASLYPVGVGAALYLTSVVVENRLVTLNIGDPTRPALCSASFDPVEPPDDLAVLDAYDRPAGVLVSAADRLRRFQAWRLGTHALGTRAEFAAGVVIPVPSAGVEGLLLADGTVVTGHVWLVGEDGVVLRKGDGNSVRVDVVGDPLFRRRLCSPAELFATPRFIRTVNGVAPNDAGDFFLTVNNEMAGDTVLRVYPDPARGLVVEVVGQELEDVV